MLKTNEKDLIVNKVINGQNTRVIACNRSGVPPKMLRKTQVSMIVFAAVASDGEVMAPCHA